MSAHFLTANYTVHLLRCNKSTVLFLIIINFKVTFDDFKEGFVAVLSQAIEQLSSSEDEDAPSDSTAGTNVYYHWL